MSIRVEALPTAVVESLQKGEPDSYGNLPEHRISGGTGVPCRHCLRQVAAGKPYLIVAHRPFSSVQPYAETGPIFIHAEPCERASADTHLPDRLSSDRYIVRGYDAEERIVYGTGDVVATDDIPAYSKKLLSQPNIEFIHVRSAQNNCFQCRVEDDSAEIGR